MNFNMAMSTPKGACKRSRKPSKKVATAFSFEPQACNSKYFWFVVEFKSCLTDLHIWLVFKQLHIVELVHYLDLKSS